MRSALRRTGSSRPATTIAIAALVVAGAGTAVAAARPAAPAKPALVRTHNFLSGLGLAKRLGAVAPGTEMTVAVALNDPNEKAETALAYAVTDPKSPLYRQYPTPAEYAARFALPAATRAATLAWLTGGGLTVGFASPLGDVVEARGPVSAINRLFHVQLGRYHLAGVDDFIANDVAPSVPAALPITSVIGLNTLEHFSTTLDQEKAALTGGKAHPAARKAGSHPAVGVFTQSIEGKQLRTAYDATDDNQGQGAKSGIFIDGNANSVIASLRVFEANRKLPRVPTKIVYTEGGTPDLYGDDAGGDEWMLDSDASTSMAPQMGELDYYSTHSLSDPDVLTEFAYWANDAKGPLQMNASFGECEASFLSPLLGQNLLNPPIPAGQGLGNLAQPMEEKILMQAFTEGRTLFASTGDTGSSCPVVYAAVVGAGNGLANQGVPLQGYPAVGKWTTAVGGTVISVDGAGKRTNEQSWFFTGGGASLFNPRPDIEKTEPNINRPCVPIQYDGQVLVPGTICRGMPDVSAMSGDQLNSFDVVFDEGESASGGTSLSSPLTMGMWTLVQAASASGTGPASAKIYQLGANPTTRARDFYDVTQGEYVTNGLYIPGPGWDYASGYGVFDIKNLLGDVDGRTAPQHANTVTVADQPTGSLKGNAIACQPFGTSPLGDVNDPVLFTTQSPSLDVQKASMDLSADKQNLVITVEGPSLAPNPPTAAALTGTFVQVSWQYAGKTWYAKADVGAAGQKVSYSDGQLDASSAPTHTDTGSFPTGKVTINVPLKNIGSPPPGARLSYPVAASGETVAVLGLTADVAGSTNDYTVGQVCKATPVKTPTKKPTKPTTVAGGGTTVTPPKGSLAATGVPAILGLVALLTTGTGLVVRRRTTARD